MYGTLFIFVGNLQVHFLCRNCIVSRTYVVSVHKSCRVRVSRNIGRMYILVLRNFESDLHVFAVVILIHQQALGFCEGFTSIPRQRCNCSCGVHDNNPVFVLVLTLNIFMSTGVDADDSSFWNMFYSLPLELEEIIGGKYSLLVCDYVLEYDGAPHDGYLRDDSIEAGLEAYLVRYEINSVRPYSVEQDG